MQSVTAIICRKRDATVGDTGKGGKKREEMGGEEKKKRLYEGGKARKEEWPKFRATLYRLGLLNFMRRPSFLSLSPPFFFFTALRAPLKRDTRATFRCSHDAERLCMNARYFYACKQTRNANYVRREF